MFKENRLVYKNNIEVTADIGSDLLSIVGKGTRRLRNGVERGLFNTIESAVDRIATAVKTPIETLRADVRNICAPLEVLDGETGVMDKLGKSITSVAKDTVWGTIRDTGHGLIDEFITNPAGGTVDILKEAAAGTYEAVSAPLGGDVKDALTIATEYDDKEKERMARCKNIGPEHLRGAA